MVDHGDDDQGRANYLVFDIFGQGIDSIMKWKVAPIGAVLGTLLLVGGGLLLLPSNLRAGKGGEIKVFLGNPDAWGPLKSAWYAASRHALLEAMAATHERVEASVVFSRYLTPPEAEGVLGRDGIAALEIFAADPSSCAGGGSVLQPHETIESAYGRFIFEFQGAMTDCEEAAEDVRRAQAGEWRLVAVRVSADPDALLALTKHAAVRLVDPLYHPAAEQMAFDRGTVVKYITVPIRPDGRPF